MRTPQVNINISVLLDKGTDVQAMASKVSAFWEALKEQMPIAEPTAPAIASGSVSAPSPLSAEENALREAYRLKMGKGFRLTKAQAELVKTGETTALVILRAIMQQLEDGSETPEHLSETEEQEGHGEDDGEYM